MTEHRHNFLSFSARMISAAIIVVSCLGANTSCAQSSTSATIGNPSFDEVSGGMPAGWNLDPNVAGKGTVEVLAAHPGGTGNVLALRPNRRNGGDAPLGVGQLVPAVDLRGQTLTVSALLGADGSSAAVVGVHVLGSGGNLPFVQLRAAGGDGSLSLYEESLVIPSGAENLVLYAVVDGQAGNAYFDDISVQPRAVAAAAPSPSPAPGPVAAIPPLNARIDIDIKQHVRDVPRTLFGTNAEWIFDGQGLWSAQAGALASEAVRLSQRAGVSLIRFPGGVFSDYYHWRDGVGPQSRRPVTAHYPGAPSSRHSFGTDEAAEFAGRIGARLLVTVNAGTGTPDEAADWVRYLNRNASPDDDVTYWEIGNELYMQGDLSGAHLTPEQYADRFAEFSSAMRAVDPGIRLGAIGGLNYGSYRFIADDDWSEVVLSRNAGTIDFLSVHNAYAPVLIGVSDAMNPLDVYRALLAAPLQIERNLADLNALVARYERPGKSIGLAVTEWGPFFHVLPDSPWVDHVKTFGSALFVANSLNVFLRTPRLEVATFFKLTDNGFMGWIGNRDGEFVETAPYLAFKLYTDNVQGSVVATDVAAPATQSPSVGVVGREDDVPVIDAVTTVGDGRATIFIVNRDLSRPVRATIAIAGVRGVSRASIETLTASAIDAHLGSELPSIPGLSWAPQRSVARFDQGGDGEVRLSESGISPDAVRVDSAGTSIEIELEALSVTAVVLDGVEVDP